MKKIILNLIVVAISFSIISCGNEAKKQTPETDISISDYQTTEKVTEEVTTKETIAPPTTEPTTEPPTECPHEWVEADCKNPKTCKLCGKTEGESLPHTWIEATCTEAKHCEVCGTTEGEPLAHKWVEATCTEAKHCEICGTTEGEPLGHSWIEATHEAPKTCSVCGLTEGEPLPPEIQINFTKEFPIELNSYDYKGNISDTVYITGVNYSYTPYSYFDYKDTYSLTLYFSGEKTYDVNGAGQSRSARVSVKIYDEDGYVVDDDTFYSPALCVGDRFRDEECKIYKIKKGTYTVELLSTN